jgi:oxygen-independent coproporphyrinogen-3 oxidase
VFSRAVFDKYTTRLCAEIEHAYDNARRIGVLIEPTVDSIYFGGGTPTLLTVEQLQRVFVTIRQNFKVQDGAEITVECAPGTLSPDVLDCLAQNKVNRVSLGVQSFIDQEARSVGRLHSREIVLDDIGRLRSAGIANINVDLIAGLPHQTVGSWNESVELLMGTGIPHASVYMLEVDEESRLGREMIAGGQKYHAHFVPDEDLTADLYEIACERLNAAGIQQYEISNFARAGFESKHNLKYWTRQPYLGFGVDAHSMLSSDSHSGQINAVRFSNSDKVESYLGDVQPEVAPVSRDGALQEAYFLGLRLTRGVDLQSIAAEFGKNGVPSDVISECLDSGLIEQKSGIIRLTAKGRMLSNEVFERFISETVSVSS